MILLRRLESSRSLAEGEVHRRPLAIVQAVQQFWDATRREDDQVQVQVQVQVQKSEAARRRFELERVALTQKRVGPREARRSTRLPALGRDDHESPDAAQQRDSARLLSDSEAEFPEFGRLRKALGEAVASKEAPREKAARGLDAEQRAAEEARAAE